MGIEGMKIGGWREVKIPSELGLVLSLFFYPFNTLSYTHVYIYIYIYHKRSEENLYVTNNHLVELVDETLTYFLTAI